MTTGMNLWDGSVWSFVITMSALLIAMLVANTLRNNSKFLRQLMIPSSVLGGFLLLIVLFLVEKLLGHPLITRSQLEVLTYHGLGLGFAAMSLRNVDKKQDKRSKTGAFDCGVQVISGYLIQAIAGLAVTLLLYKVLGSFFASGALLPMGYGQGPGQAYNWGHNYEVGYGFTHGTSFGLTVAAMGFVSASVGGVFCLISLRRKGILKREFGEILTETLELKDFTGNDEIPLSESMDKFTIQVALVFIAYFLSYLFMAGFNLLIEAGVFGGLGGTLQSLIWGFQFLFASIFGILIKMVLRGLKKKGVIKREYTNNFMQDRISGFMFDIMVVASIAAIDLSAFKEPSFVVPLTIISVLGAVITYVYHRFCCRYIFPQYEHEAFISLYGMQTGTASTGIILLRELDPYFETQAADNIVYHQLWGMVFGLPFMLLMGLFPKSPSSALLGMFICIGMFIVYNIILFRRFIFRKKGAARN